MSEMIIEISEDVAELSISSPGDPGVELVADALVQSSPNLSVDFSVAISGDDPAVITLTASGDVADQYFWIFSCEDEPVRVLGEGAELVVRIPCWGSWDITLRALKAGSLPGSISKTDVNDFTGNEHLFLPFDYLNTGESFAWDYMSGVVKLKSKFNDQPFCVQMIRDITTAYGTAGDLLQVGWDEFNLIDVAAIRAGRMIYRPVLFIGFITMIQMLIQLETVIWYSLKRLRLTVSGLVRWEHMESLICI